MEATFPIFAIGSSFFCGPPAAVCNFDYAAENRLDCAFAVCDFALAAGVFAPAKAPATVFDFPAGACAAPASFFYTAGGAPGSAVFALRSNFSIFYIFPGQYAADRHPNAYTAASFFLFGPVFPVAIF